MLLGRAICSSCVYLVSEDFLFQVCFCLRVLGGRESGLKADGLSFCTSLLPSQLRRDSVGLVQQVRWLLTHPSHRLVQMFQNKKYQTVLCNFTASKNIRYYFEAHMPTLTCVHTQRKYIINCLVDMIRMKIFYKKSI